MSAATEPVGAEEDEAAEDEEEDGAEEVLEEVEEEDAREGEQTLWCESQSLCSNSKC